MFVGFYTRAESAICQVRLHFSAKYQVSVAQIIQKDTKVEGCAEVVVITESVREGDFRTAIEELRNRDSVRKISTIIRVYGK